MANRSLKASLWIFPNDSNQKTISLEEQSQASLLPNKKSLQYRISRGNIRYVISNLFRIDPLKVPLHSLPGEAPLLGNDFGYISISHSSDCLLIGWSETKIGVDIEKISKNPINKEIADRFFNEKDKLRIKNKTEHSLKKEILKLWVIKESLIKWQRGDLFNGLKDWYIDEKLKIAFLKGGKFKVNIKNLRFKYWEIGIASSNKLKKRDISINFQKNFLKT